MPYSNDVCGIYKITNDLTNKCYVGQSVNIKKRIAEHFRTLRKGEHANSKLQNAFNKYGENAFSWSIEVYCEDPEEMDLIEEAFISGEAHFEEELFFNIASFAKAPMRGKNHTEESKRKIREGRRNCGFDYSSTEYREKLSSAQRKRFMSDPEFVSKIKFIVNNDHMSYAAIARALKADTSAVRKLAIKYKHLKGTL